MKILAIETSCDETAAAVIELSRLPLTANRLKENIIINTNQAESGQPIAECRILSNVVASQIKLHQKFGGVFPEHASRAHSEKIISVFQEALIPCLQPTANSKQQKVNKPLAVSRELSAGIDIIAVTTGPGLIGSLLVGVNFAKTYAYVHNLPIIGLNHWLGHIYSCFAGEFPISNFQFSNKTEGMSFCEMPVTRTQSESRLDRVAESKMTTRGQIPSFPLLALIVSGGHTGLVLMKSHTEIIPLGETLDDAAGEAFDKVAKLLQLGYPGGPAIAGAAAEFSITNFKFSKKSQSASRRTKIDFKFPRPMLDRKDYNFSFSGLKTAVLYEVNKLKSQGITLHNYQSPVAFEFQQAVIDILIGKTLQAARQYQPKSILICGGVSANYELRRQMAQAVAKLPHNPSFHTPPLPLTTDNALMMAIAAAYQLTTDNRQLTTWDKISANANQRL